MANLRYAPEFKLMINDSPAPAALRASISSVNFQSSFDGADRVELTLVNENLRWLDHVLLDMDNKLTLFMGYAPDALSLLFAGEIVSQTAEFPASGSPTLTIAAQDRRHRLQKGKKARWFAVSTPSYGNIPVSDDKIADFVSREYGLFPITDPIGAALSVVLGGVQTVAAMDDPDTMQSIIRKQATESDLDFLKRISVENGWDMLIDHSGSQAGYKLRFMSPLEHLNPDLTLKYGQSLLDFYPRLSTVGQIAGVTANIWISSSKMEYTISVAWNWDRQQLDLGITPGSGAGDSGSENQKSAAKPTWTLVDEPLSVANAPRAILGKLIPLLNQRLTGSGSTVGDPRILPGKVLRLEGLGEKFGGLYRVTSASHIIDSGGYRTSFEVRKEIWFGSIPLPQQGAVSVRL